MNLRKSLKENALPLLIVFLLLFFLYYNVVFSDKPIGLDAMGHVSKTSYLRESNFAKWDQNWYAGTPVLQFYSPLVYYLAAIIGGSIPFVLKAIVFLSIFLTAAGIYFFVKQFNENKPAPVFASVLFLTVISTAYYFVSVGNYIFMATIWAIPFALLFVEKSFLEKNKKNLLAYYAILLIAVLSHFFVAGIIVFLTLITCLLKGKLGVKTFFALVIPPLLISSFWLLPFFDHQTQYQTDGTTPEIQNLLGLPGLTTPNYSAWGLGKDAIGVSILLLALVIGLRREKILENKLSRNLLALAILAFLATSLFPFLFSKIGFGVPLGMELIRFIVPTAIALCLFIGVEFEAVSSKKIFLATAVLLLSIGLIQCFRTIELNANELQVTRMPLLETIASQPGFPLNNESSQYRFGTNHYQISASLNYLFPRQQQTFGYYDQGMLYPKTLDSTLKGIWDDGNLNKTKFYLDWFGIKYFEVLRDNTRLLSRIEKEPEFRAVQEGSRIFSPFIIVEYLKPNPVISVIRGTTVKISEKESESYFNGLAQRNENSQAIIPVVTEEKISTNSSYELLDYSVNRQNPDEIEVNLFGEHENAIVLVREFHHPAWEAWELPSNKKLPIIKAGPNFMSVFPGNNAEKIVFKYGQTLVEKIGLLLSALGLACVMLASFGFQKVLSELKRRRK